MYVIQINGEHIELNVHKNIKKTYESKKLDNELKRLDNESKKLDNDSNNIKLQLILAKIDLSKLKKT